MTISVQLGIFFGKFQILTLLKEIIESNRHSAFTPDEASFLYFGAALLFDRVVIWDDISILMAENSHNSSDSLYKRKQGGERRLNSLEQH